MYDVVVVGAGPAGLSAALLLGRCRRHTLVCDIGQPRNRNARSLHAFLTRDGISPTELLRIGREQLSTYSSVELHHVEVIAARQQDQLFEVDLRNGRSIRCRTILLATGVVDDLPKIPGIKELYGTSVFHCPYCDGWEVRDQPLVIYGSRSGGIGLTRTLTRWSSDLILCSDGPAELSDEDLRWLARMGIPVREERIVRLEGRDGQLKSVVFDTGEQVARRALFFNTGQGQRSNLATQLGCRMTAKGSVVDDESCRTSVPGVYVAGDASRDVQLAIVAAAEGVKAAFAINKFLQQVEWNSDR